MRTFAKNLGILTKKTKKSLILALVLLAAGAATAWLAAWPYPVLDASRRDNLLLTDLRCTPLKTAAPATLLYNVCFPDRDHSHYRMLIRRPATVDSLCRYPALVVVQGAGEPFDSLAQAWPAMDSCYVLVVGSAGDKSPLRNGLLRQLDASLPNWLDRCGMRIDPDNLTLVDRTAQGLQALELGHRRVRNLILPHATADTSRVLARRVHLVPPTPGDTSRMNASFRQLQERLLDADLYSPGDSLQHVARDIVLERNPISQSRLSWTLAQAKSRGYDDRYVMFADFSLPSGKNRFFVYDYALGRVVVRSKCAHGCGSGSTERVARFSNEHGSCATSLGLYEIDNVHRMYKNGRMAINVEGLDTTNSNARMRGIKVHGGMRYEGEIYPRYLKLGKLSEGCFALSNVPLSAVLMLVEQSAPRQLLLSAYTH